MKSGKTLIMTVWVSGLRLMRCSSFYQFLLCSLVLFAVIDSVATQKVTTSTAEKWELSGTYAKLRPGDIEVVYQIPPHVKGVLFLAHGCSHQATDWWPKSPSCPHCFGLPIETNITREALYQRHYAVLAVSSEDRGHKCWLQLDSPRAITAISYFYRDILKVEYSAIPLYLLGGSSGGAFVGHLAQQKDLRPPASAVCVVISSINGHPDDLKAMAPTIFVLMGKDQRTLRHVKSLQIPKAKIVLTDEKAIVPSFFYDKSSGLISLSDSKSLQQAFLTKGLIDSNTLKLVDDPRQSEWRSIAKAALPHWIPSMDSLRADSSAISEILNVAWNMHELTDEYNKVVFDWFDQYGK